MDLYRMERKIIDSKNDVISKDYALAFVFACRRRVKELEDEIHHLRFERLKIASTAPCGEYEK